jgi:hypothetical protein
MGEHGPRDGQVAVDQRFVDEINRLKVAGNALAEAAHRVQNDYDGVHRLRVALVGWYQALADEWDRG